MGRGKDQLKTGVLLSYFNLALSCVIPLLYTPIVLRILGQEEYGLYALANTAVGYLSLLSLGFGSTILRYLSFYHAKGQIQEERKAFGFFLLLYCAIAMLVVLGGFVLSTQTEAIFKRGLTAEELPKMRILLVVIAISSAVTFPNSVFSSVAMAHERYLFRKIVDLLLTVLTPASYLIVLWTGHSSVGMAVVGLLVHMAILPVNIWYCISILHIRPLFGRIPGSLLKEMLGFSGFAFMATIVDMLFWSTDKFLLGMMLGTAQVAVYNIGGTFNTMVMGLSSSISDVLAPRVTAMVAQEKGKERLSELFFRAGRLQFLIIALVITGFSVFGRAFIRLWAGEAYADAYWIAILTMFPLCIPLIQNTGLSIVIAQNKHAFRSTVYLIIAIANVVSTALIIPAMGGVGAALCSGVSYILGQGLIMNWFYWRKIGIDIPRFWREIGKMALLPAAMMAVGLGAKRFVALPNWASFFGAVLVYTLLYCAGMYYFALNQEEKELVHGALNKLRRK